MKGQDPIAPAAILVVEDDPDLRRNITALLRLRGHSVVAAVDNGPDAIEAVRRGPDLILMDVRLRGSMDGITTAEAIRRRWDGPLIYLTAYSDRETVSRAGMAEPAGYLVKPFDDAGLDAAIRIALANHHRARARQRWVSALIEQLAGADEAMCAIDETGRVRLVNTAAEALFARARRDLIGERLADILDPDWSDDLLAAVDRVVHGESSVSVPLDGHRAVIAPIGRARRQPPGVLITLRPDTDDPTNPLICVCSWCRRIRDPAARWTRFEEYFAAAMDAQFTHSICPDCTEGLLGESGDGLLD